MDTSINFTPLFIEALFKGLGNAISYTWHVLLIILAIFIFRIYKYISWQRKIRKAGLLEVDKMSGSDFEHFLTSLFSKLGYSTKHVGKRGDYGIDLVVTIDSEKIAIQSKRYGMKHKVGEDAVREALAGINMYGCSRSIVVTNSYFTWMAKRLAKANSVELWDRNKLANIILHSKTT